MTDLVPQFTYLVEELKKLKLAYLHLIEARTDGGSDIDVPKEESLDFLVKVWGKTSPILIAGGFDAEGAKAAVDSKYKELDVAIVFGRYFISNPDLVFKLKEGIPFVPYDRNKFYGPKQVEGYTTYPFSKEFEAAQVSKA